MFKFAKFILFIASVLFVLSIFIVSAPFAAVLKISTAYPDGTYVVKTLKAAGKEIEEKTEGRIKLKFYPGGVQGDNKTVLKKIKRGILQGALVEGGALAGDYKDSQVYNAPMVFKSFDEVDYVRSKMDSHIIKGFDKAGWKVFGLIDSGFAYAMTNHKVKTIQELNEQKLWLPANDPLSEKVAGALGLSPIFLGIGEVLTALQTGAVNAIAAPPAATLILQWYSRLKFVINAPFMYTYGTLAISNTAFAKMKKEDQVTVNAILTATIKKVDKTAREDNIKAFAALKTQGLEIVVPEASQAEELRKSAEKATRILVEKGEFSKEILQKLNALLLEHRNVP